MAMTINGIEYITVTEAAEYLGLQPNRMRQLVSGTKRSRARFKPLKVGNTNLVMRREVEDYKEEREQNP
jgi:excisionase family DNA binding protein